MSAARKATPRASDLDRRIGRRVRELRIRAGWTQQQLADAIGITYQQAHKYERGINRIAAGRLFAIAEALEVEPAELLSLPDRPARQAGEGMLRTRVAADLFARLEPRHQEAILALMRALAA